MKKFGKILFIIFVLAFTVSALALVVSADGSEGKYILNGESVDGEVSAVIGAKTYVAVNVGTGRQSYELISGNTLGSVAYRYAVDDSVKTDTNIKNAFAAASSGQTVTLLSDIVFESESAVAVSKSLNFDLNGFQYLGISTGDYSVSNFEVSGTNTAFSVYSSRPGASLIAIRRASDAYAQSFSAIRLKSSSASVRLGSLNDNDTIKNNLSVYTHRLIYTDTIDSASAASKVTVDGGSYYKIKHDNDNAWIGFFHFAEPSAAGRTTADIKNAKIYIASAGDFVFYSANTDTVVTISDNSVIAGNSAAAIFKSATGISGSSLINFSDCYILLNPGDISAFVQNVGSGVRTSANAVLDSGSMEFAKLYEQKTFVFAALSEDDIVTDAQIATTPIELSYGFTRVTATPENYSTITWKHSSGAVIASEKWYNASMPKPPISLESNDFCASSFGQISPAVGGTSKTYTVRETLKFPVKVNLSLASNFVYNIYVPSNVDIGTVYREVDYTKSELTYEYVTINQEGYYQYSIPITASAAANEYLVHLTLPNTNGGVVDAENPTFNYTMKISVPAYAYQVLNLGYGEKTNELMLAALMYIKCACDNFETVSQNVYYDKTVEILGSRVLEPVEGTPMQEISPAVKEFVRGVVPGFDKELMYCFVINEAYTTLTSPAPTVSYYEYGKQKTYTVTEADVAQGYFIITFKAMDILSDVVVSYNGDTFTYNFGNHIYNKNNSATSTQAYKNLLYSLYAYSVAAKDYLASHDETPIVNVTINGNSLDTYTAVYDTASAQKAATSFVSLVNGEYGTNISVSTSAQGNKIIFKKISPSSPYDCKITVVGNDLVVECAYDSFFNTAAFTFVTEYFLGLNKSVNFDEGFEKDYYYGKILYSEFGALGDGVSDDFAAIKEAHSIANFKGYPVFAESGKTYYIKNTDSSGISIKTDTDWCGAEFIIDDRGVPSYINASIFNIANDYVSIDSTSSATLKNLVNTLNANKTDGVAIDSETVTKLDTGLGYPAMLIVENTKETHYIRYGYNDAGVSQKELVIVDENGNISSETPFLYDYSDVTKITAYRIDVGEITVANAKFTTLNDGVHTESYINGRGIKITRSNVTLKNVNHSINELSASAPYSGFYQIENASNVIIDSCNPTARLKASEGTYDISMTFANNVTLKNCIQSNFFVAGTEESSNPIPNVSAYWGIMGSNLCKNLAYDGCALTRFDAHKGVYNATIRNSKVSEINLIGGGDFILENTALYSAQGIYMPIIRLREDYGSSWNGNLIIKDVVINFSENASGTALTLVDASWANFEFAKKSSTSDTSAISFKNSLPNVVIDGIALGNNASSVQEIVIYRFLNLSAANQHGTELTDFNSEWVKYATSSCNTHADANSDGKCDGCGLVCQGDTVKNYNRYIASEYVLIASGVTNKNGVSFSLSNQAYTASGAFLDGVILCTEHIDADRNGVCDNACGMGDFIGKVPCEKHIDRNSDGLCDECEESFTCIHKDRDTNGTCDECEAPYTCPGHKDTDGDSICDECGAEYICPGHRDADGNEICDICQAPYICPGHKDTDGNSVCDECGAPYTCPGHWDADGNEICDICQAPFVCSGHKDADGDSHCNNCGAYFECEHKDKNSDTVCDKCEAPYTCPGHKDNDGDSCCNICGANFECVHKDVNSDSICDECEAPYTCPGHKDNDGDSCCNICGANFECVHKDVNSDSICDECEAPYTCPGHWDADGNEICDICQAPFVCSGHKDADGDSYCNNCGAYFECEHKDKNSDSICDECEAEFVCEHKDVNSDAVCDKCEAVFACEHKDKDVNGKCDKCEADYVCPGHWDANGDAICDRCDADFVCSAHKDADGDSHCNNCGAHFVCEHIDRNWNDVCDNCDSPIIYDIEDNYNSGTADTPFVDLFKTSN